VFCDREYLVLAGRRFEERLAQRFVDATDVVPRPLWQPDRQVSVDGTCEMPNKTSTIPVQSGKIPACSASTHNFRLWLPTSSLCKAVWRRTNDFGHSYKEKSTRKDQWRLGNT